MLQAENVKEGGRGGRIRLLGAGLELRFPYNKERFTFICKLKGARFDKESKHWQLPIAAARKLLISELFAPATISYEFTKEELEAALLKCEDSIKDAQRRLLENPFAVPKELLSRLELDVVFRFAAQSASVRAVPRYRSKAKKLLKDTPGVHYIKKERAYFFPAHLLSDFLKTLRDKQLSFGVEEELGERLKRSGKLRTQIVEGKYAANAEELRETILLPFLERLKEGEFCLSECTTEQLGICFPKQKQFSAKKSAAHKMIGTEMIEVIFRAKRNGLRIWLTRDVENYIESSRCQIEKRLSERESFADAELAIVDPEIAWVTWTDGVGGLLCKQELFKQKLKKEYEEVVKQSSVEKVPDRGGSFFLRFLDSRLLCSYEALSKGLRAEGVLVPESESFRALIGDLENRQKLLALRGQYQELRDVQGILANEELEKKLYPHQRVAVKWLLENKTGLLGDDMGLGKTLAVLAAFSELREKNESDFLLVVCPNSLVRNWARESEQWTRELYFCAFPTERKSQESLLRSLSTAASSVSALAINYESLRLERVLPRIEELCQHRKVFLCVDESQRAKNSQSKTFKAINRIACRCERRVLLSGTPVPRDISDIWAQMLLLDRGERFGTRFYEWLPKVAELGNKWSEYAVKRFIPEAVEETILRVQELLLRRKKEQVLSLPPKIFSFRDIELSGEQKKRYDEVREDLLLRVTSMNGDSFTRSIESILEEYLRAVQVASNPRLIDPNWKGEPAKFVELDEIIKEIVEEKGERIVIWTNYLKNVEELVTRYKRLGAAAFSGEVPTKERANLIGQFQSGADTALKILVAVPAAGGVGITLTAAQTAVYVERTWNAEHWLQSVDRIHRIGQQGTVNIVVLNACKVDELIGYNLRRKEKMQQKLLGDNKSNEQHSFPSREELLEALYAT